LRGRRVLVMGLGLFGGGAGAARWLVEQGARVTVTDLKGENELRETVEALRGLDIEWRLGGHREEAFRRAELTLVSPAVPLDSPWLRFAGALETEINLFFKLCRSRRMIGVTGSNGKTTTCALIHAALPGSRLGGNFGGSLLGELAAIGPDDPVVLELSSFQLERLGAIGRSPQIAVVTNLTPNHLDRHVDMREYAEAKRQLVAHQRPWDSKILNADDAAVSRFEGPGRTLTFSLRREAADAWFDGDAIRVRGERVDVRRRRLPGLFNVANMAAAALAVWAAQKGRLTWHAEMALNGFAGIEHRLELVAEVRGVRFYNDSIATNPESTVAALGALGGPLLLILGGSDKRLPFEGLGRAARERGVKFAALFGQTAAALDAALDGVPRETAADLDGAVRACLARAHPGDAVVLSPACASFGMFRNFAERGARFKSIVRSLAG
jgi:UDP-N-acetylmuramoylalanine--D-glutamate ligase